MADSFFGFDTSLVDSSLEDVLDCPFEDDDLGEEEEYDALNDETFGSEATIGDWEQDHEKLAEIAESTRPQVQNPVTQKNGVDRDIENSLSHLILDDKKRSTPQSNVWDNINLPKLPNPQSLSPIPLKNVCTVEELERRLIANRPPPGLGKPHQTQQKSQHQPQLSQHKPEGSFLFENLNLNEKFPINNGLLPPRFPPPGLGVPTLVVPPNMRLPPPPQFVQHHRLLPNQPGNLLRYPLPPHLMIPPGTQRQPLRGAFCGNFPPPPHPALGSSLFLRPDHPLMPSFSDSQTNQQSHNFAHTGNQRNLNRPFHHNDQPGNHQPFFKNNQYQQHHNRNNQRNYYHQQNHFQTANGLGDYDEYAGLMSAREKQWLINIQLLQLNTNQPYVDDYYYTVFCNRQNRQNRNRDQRDRNQRNHNGNHRDSRDKDQPHLISKVVYTPTQFENSLGKLQCGSVTAPRKIIDMDVVPNSDPQSTSLSQQKDTKKTRQLLLEIERLYNIQLELEDLSNPLALLTNQQPQEGENENIPVKKTAPELISMMLMSFSQLILDDKLTGVLSIRKGKTLLLRFLPHVTLPQYSKQLLEIWKNIFLGLNIISRRDSHLLINLFPEFQNWIESITDFETLIQLVTKFSSSVTSSKNNSLAFAITNKFGVSVITSILEQGATLFPTENNKKSIPVWSNFINSLIDAIGDSHPCVAPCRPIAANTLNQHLKRMSSIKVEDYAVLELFLTDVNPSSNT